MTRSRFLQFVGPVILGLALAGCGATPQAPDAQPAPTTATAAEGPATIAPTAQAVGMTATAASAEPTLAAAATATLATATPGAVATAPAPTAGAAATAVGPAGSAVPPETLTAMIADLAARLSLAPAAISVVSAEAVSWPDGSLGCPQPGMMYPQVVTEGVRVVLAAGGSEYAYHGDDRGQFFYCQNP